MKVLDRAPFFSMMRKGEYAISEGGTDERFAWDDAYCIFFHSSEMGKNNGSRFDNKEMDALLEKGRIPMYWEARAAKKEYRFAS